MLTRLILLKNPLVLTLHECRKGRYLVPSNTDLEIMEKIIGVLKIFDTATEIISGEKYPTVNFMNSRITRIKTHLGENKFDESESIKEIKK